jgi:hypothetical protein
MHRQRFFQPFQNTMTTKKKIEVFSAGCSTCKETIELVKGIAGSSHELVIHDMHQSETASPLSSLTANSQAAAQAVARMSMSYVLRWRSTGYREVFLQEPSSPPAPL